ncbi:MAG: hypothetical protein ABIS47_07890 [Acidimicrobiales bacterium]
MAGSGVHKRRWVTVGRALLFNLPTDRDRSFGGYLDGIRRQPGFMTRIAATLAFALAGFRTGGLVPGVLIVVGTLAFAVPVGYMIWRGHRSN